MPSVAHLQKKTSAKRRIHKKKKRGNRLESPMAISGKKYSVVKRNSRKKGREHQQYLEPKRRNLERLSNGTYSWTTGSQIEKERKISGQRGVGRCRGFSAARSWTGPWRKKKGRGGGVVGGGGGGVVEGLGSRELLLVVVGLGVCWCLTMNGGSATTFADASSLRAHRSHVRSSLLVAARPLNTSSAVPAQNYAQTQRGVVPDSGNAQH